MTQAGQEAATAPVGGAQGAPVRGRSVVRFAIVSAVAFTIDTGLALVLKHGLHLPWWLAVGIAFSIIGAASYFVHEYWTFATAQSRATANRLARTLVVSAVSVGCRVGVVFLLEMWREPATDLVAVVYIGLAAGASLGINYLLNRFWVFDRR